MSTPTITQRLKQPLPNDRLQWIKQDGTLSKIAQQFFAQQSQAQTLIVPALISSSHASRQQFLATAYANGSIFYETDRRIYYIAIGGVWFYASGVMQATQSGLPTDLTQNADFGFQVYVTDYNHLLIWTGQAWNWGPGDDGSGYISQFIQPQAGSAIPNTPNPGTGWQACDGSANVLTLQADGTLQFTTVPNSAGFFFRQ